MRDKELNIRTDIYEILLQDEMGMWTNSVESWIQITEVSVI